MSVRRLADENVQPASFAFNEANKVWAEATIKKYPVGREQSAVIPLLMRAQEQDGWVTRAAIEAIAGMLNMAYIRVLEVATFYTQFQLKPVGTRAHVQVCGTTPCMLRGAEDLIHVCKKKIAPEPFELNADGTLSWEEVECQGACVNAPMVVIFKDTYEDLSPIQLEHIIDRFASGRGSDIKPGPQIDRIYAAPTGGLTSLTEDTGRYATPGLAPLSDAPAAPAAAPAAPAPAAPAAAAPAAPAKAEKADAKPAAKAEKVEEVSLDDKDRPAAIEKPAVVDDLKMISGVGPKIEGILHSIGIFTFAQVAKWTEAERAWVNSFLKFGGRIERDDWVRQADALARGGEEEYIRVFGKKPR